jgi:hypothetical protein
VIVNQQQHQVQNVAVAPHQFRNLDLGEVLASSGAQQASREMRSFSYDISTGDRLIVNQTGNSDGSSKLFALTPSPNPCPAGGRPLAARQDAGAAAFDFKAAGFDFAFFLFVSHPRKPFTPPLIRVSHLAVFPTL